MSEKPTAPPPSGFMLNPEPAPRIEVSIGGRAAESDQQGLDLPTEQVIPVAFPVLTGRCYVFLNTGQIEAINFRKSEDGLIIYDHEKQLRERIPASSYIAQSVGYYGLLKLIIDQLHSNDLKRVSESLMPSSPMTNQVLNVLAQQQLAVMFGEMWHERIRGWAFYPTASSELATRLASRSDPQGLEESVQIPPPAVDLGPFGVGAFEKVIAESYQARLQSGSDLIGSPVTVSGHMQTAGETSEEAVASAGTEFDVDELKVADALLTNAISRVENGIAKIDLLLKEISIAGNNASEGKV